MVVQVEAQELEDSIGRLQSAVEQTQDSGTVHAKARSLRTTFEDVMTYAEEIDGDLQSRSVSALEAAQPLLAGDTDLQEQVSGYIRAVRDFELPNLDALPATLN